MSAMDEQGNTYAPTPVDGQWQPLNAPESPQRTVICGDAVEWCLDHAEYGPVVTSPPDAAEVGMDIPEWGAWFDGAVMACLNVTGERFPAVFYVTDRRHVGAIYSKADAVMAAAGSAGYQVLWHKIALRRSPGKLDLYRPTYSHMIAVGPRSTRGGKATPDVFDRGPVLYPNGMGATAARMAVEFVSKYAVKGAPVVNPYCGRGTVLAAASEAGLRAVGIDNDEEQCAHALDV